MAQTFKGNYVSFALLALLVFAMFSFVITFQNNNDAIDPIISNSVINKTFDNLDSDISGLGSDMSVEEQNQNKDSITESSGSLVMFSISNAGKTVKGIVFGLFNVLIILPASFLGIPSQVIIIITSIVAITLIILFWRLLRSEIGRAHV